MEKRLITTTTLIVGGLFLLMAARNASPCSAQTESGLSDIPISVGEMAFNEGKNRGGDAQQLVTWKSEDLVLTTSGTFSGEFKVRYILLELSIDEATMTVYEEGEPKRRRWKSD